MRLFLIAAGFGIVLAAVLQVPTERPSDPPPAPAFRGPPVEIEAKAPAVDECYVEVFPVAEKRRKHALEYIPPRLKTTYDSLSVVY